MNTSTQWKYQVIELKTGANANVITRVQVDGAFDRKGTVRHKAKSHGQSDDEDRRQRQCQAHPLRL